MSSSTRLWVLWRMGASERRRRRAGEETPLIAADILRLGQEEGIAATELVRLEKAGHFHPLWYDWMLVIDLDKPEGQLRVEAFFGELLSLGARPMMLREAK